MLMFMLGRALGGDGMNVIFAFGAILAGTLFGWSADELAVFGIVVTMFAAAGGVLAAALDHRIGSKATILVGLGLVALGALGLVGAGEDRAVFVPIPPGPDILGYTRGEAAFVAGAILVASGSGPAIASMRTLMAKIAPLPRMTAYFGLYALVGKATNFLGPLVVAGATAVTGSVQTGLAVSLVFLALGALAFAQVREERIG
jgi:UMF1 family MFS transporter